MKFTSHALSRRKLLTAAAGAAAVVALPSRAQTLEKLEFMTEFAPHGFHAPFYLAMQRGWFKDAGIDLNLKDGRGTAATINLVGAGQVGVGFVNLSGAVIARSKGVPVKCIASILRKGTNGLIMKPGTGIKTPQQLRGKTVLYGTTTIEANLLDGYLATAGMTRDDVKMLGVDAPSKVSSVLSGKGDVAVGPVPYYLGLLEGKQEKVETLLFDDAGIRMLDFGLVAQDSTIAARPKVLASFVKVVSRAFDYTRTGNNVDEAVKAMIALRPTANIDPVTAVNMFKSHARHIDSPATAGKPVGYISPQEVRETVKTLKDVKVIEASLNPEDTYTTAFNP
jgi:NitT/TauT family transport system substrate-binding protein